MMSSRKKVLFLIPSLAGGGAERVFSTLLLHMDRSRFEMNLGLLQAQGPFVHRIPSDILVHDLKVARVRYALPAILRLIWKTHPDALLSTLGHLNLALIAVKPLMPHGTRLVVREASIVSTCLKEATRCPSLWRRLYRLLYKRADRVVCPADSVVEDLVKSFGVPRDRAIRIYNPVDIQKLRTLAESDGKPFDGLGPELVSVGRLSAEKGLDLLIDALPAVLNVFPGARLTILGTGPLLPALLEHANNLSLSGQVHFLGFQQNPWSYMKRADVVVLPSRYEGLSNVILEALALGARVIASDCPGGTREIQARNPQLMLVPPEDSGALADAIIKVCQMPRENEEMEEIAGRLCAFNLDSVVGEYERLLQEL